jgi:hypothetical protein
MHLIKSKTYQKIRKEETDLRRIAHDILREAERVDEEEDKLYGPDKNPLLHPLPPDWKERLKKLKEGKKALEERAKAKGEPVPKSTAQYNLTDPDSRTLQGRGLRQFLLRGVEKVGAEWKLWCLGHNLRKLHAAGWV